MKTKLILLGALLGMVMAFYPTKAYACDSFLCLGDMLGITDIAKRDAERKEKQAETERQRQTDVARINADAQARIAEANRQLEAQRIQGRISEAQAKAMADAFTASVNAKRDEYIAALQSNAQVAISGINETGQTERSRISWEAKSNMLTIGIVGFLVLAGLVGAVYVMRSGQGNSQGGRQIVVMIQAPQRQQLDQSDTVYLPKQGFRLIEKDSDNENR